MFKLTKLTTIFNKLRTFKNSNLGAYGIATTILSTPVFVVVAYTIDSTGSLADKTKLERAYDSVANVITTENSQYRIRTNISQCRNVSSLNNTSYDKLSSLSPACQYYVFIKDIEDKTGIKNLLNPETRNKAFTEGLVRIALGEIGNGDRAFFPRNNLITQNVKNQCDLSQNQQGQFEVACLVYGATKVATPLIGSYRSVQYEERGPWDDDPNAINLGVSSAKVRSVMRVPGFNKKPMDIVIAVDISAPYIPTDDVNYLRASFATDRNTTSNYLYSQTKQNLETVADFIGKFEDTIFNSYALEQLRDLATGLNTSQIDWKKDGYSSNVPYIVKGIQKFRHFIPKDYSNNIRLSYLAFSGGGPETPKSTKNAMPYVFRGEVFFQPVSLNDSVFHFPKPNGRNNFFQDTYFPFSKGNFNGSISVLNQGGTNQCSNTQFALHYYCSWLPNMAIFGPQQYFDIKAKAHGVDYNPGINTKESIIFQYLKSRYFENNGPYDNTGIGANNGLCTNPDYNPTGYGNTDQNRRQMSLIFGITCSAVEAGQPQDGPRIGVSSVLAGVVYDYVDPFATVAEIDSFDGKEHSNWALKRDFTMPDTVIPLATDRFASPLSNRWSNDFTYYNRKNVYDKFPNYYNFTPTRNTGTTENSPNYVNKDAELVSGWRTSSGYVINGQTKDSYNWNQITPQILKKKFSQIQPSGVQFTSSGLLLAANRMMDIDRSKISKDDTSGKVDSSYDRVIVLITNNRGEKQDLMIDNQLVHAGMCYEIRKKFAKFNLNSDTNPNLATAKIFVVDIYPGETAGNKITEEQKIHAETWKKCANPNFIDDYHYDLDHPQSEYYIPATPKDLGSKLDNLILTILTNNSDVGK